MPKTSLRKETTPIKAKEIKIGQVYAVKVSGKIAPVRITRICDTRYNPRTNRETYGGFIGKNEATGREVHIRGAARIRFEMVFLGGKWRANNPLLLPLPLPLPQERVKELAAADPDEFSESRRMAKEIAEGNETIKEWEDQNATA